MGVAYAKQDLPGQIEQSRTSATNTWTIVPMPVKVAVGYSGGTCNFITRRFGVGSADLIPLVQRATLPLAGKPGSSRQSQASHLSLLVRI
jgi:hypothetical protein